MVRTGAPVRFLREVWRARTRQWRARTEERPDCNRHARQQERTCEVPRGLDVSADSQPQRGWECTVECGPPTVGRSQLQHQRYDQPGLIYLQAISLVGGRGGRTVEVGALGEANGWLLQQQACCTTHQELSARRTVEAGAPLESTMPNPDCVWKAVPDRLGSARCRTARRLGARPPPRQARSRPTSPGGRSRGDQPVTCSRHVLTKDDPGEESGRVEEWNGSGVRVFAAAPIAPPMVGRRRSG